MGNKYIGFRTSFFCLWVALSASLMVGSEKHKSNLYLYQTTHTLLCGWYNQDSLPKLHDLPSEVVHLTACYLYAPSQADAKDKAPTWQSYLNAVFQSLSTSISSATKLLKLPFPSNHAPVLIRAKPLTMWSSVYTIFDEDGCFKTLRISRITGTTGITLIEVELADEAEIPVALQLLSRTRIAKKSYSLWGMPGSCTLLLTPTEWADFLASCEQAKSSR